MRSRLSVVVLVVMVALLLPAVALATNYWGWNNMTGNTPNACALQGSPAVACANTQANSAQTAKTSGSACIWNGFHLGYGDIICSTNVTTTISAWASRGEDPALGPKCYHVSGTYAYIQCRYFNGF